MNYLIKSFDSVPVTPTNVTPNMSIYLAEEDASKWVEVDGAHIRDEENEDFTDIDLDVIQDLRDEADENLYAFVENVCNEYGLTYEKIEDNTGDSPSYYYYIHDKAALIAAAKKYVAGQRLNKSPRPAHTGRGLIFSRITNIAKNGLRKENRTLGLAGNSFT